MILALAIFVHQMNRREAFADIDCADISDCKTCAVADKCSWCPKLNLCIYTSSITSTDKNCNQMNVVNSSEGCSVNKTLAPIKIDESIYDSRTYKNDFYKNLPPGVYTADEVKYSNEDVMGSVTNMQNDLKNLRGEIPYIVSSSVENNIRQIVKGILAENYYIQGFEDIKNYRAV